MKDKIDYLENIVDSSFAYKTEGDKVLKVTAVTEVEYKGAQYIGIGVARTHPDDVDFATKMAGERLSYFRSLILVLEMINEAKPSSEIGLIIKDLEEEIEANIERKTKMFDRLRNAREGNYKDRVRTYFQNEVGDTFEVTGLEKKGANK